MGQSYNDIRRRRAEEKTGEPEARKVRKAMRKDANRSNRYHARLILETWTGDIKSA